MSFQSRAVFVLLWIVSLMVVGALVNTSSAQIRPEPGAVISGNDIGFRPEGWNGKTRTGTFVVRIDGQWVEAAGAMKRVPATR